MGIWFLDGQTLVDFVTNGNINMKRIEIGLLGVNEKQFIEGCAVMRNEVKKIGNVYETIVYHAPEYKIPKVYVKLYRDFPSDIICSPENIRETLRGKDPCMSQSGTWNYLIDELQKYALPVPYKTGTFLDMTQPLWFKDVSHTKDRTGGEKFFNTIRTQNAVALMKMLHEAAATAGFPEHIFPGFGTLLGIIREGDFIQSDRDMDHCIMGNNISKLQEERFLVEVAKERYITDAQGVKRFFPKGLYEGRKRKPKRRHDNGRFLWTSCGHLKPHSQQGCKSCIWKFFNWDGYAWHSKGSKWVQRRKFNDEEFNYDLGNTDAIAKGIKAEYLREFTKMQFKGITINVPKLAGSVLDAWYPGWGRARSGASRKIDVMIVPKWNESKGWYRA